MRPVHLYDQEVDAGDGNAGDGDACSGSFLGGLTLGALVVGAVVAVHRLRSSSADAQIPTGKPPKVKEFYPMVELDWPTKPTQEKRIR